MWGFVVTTTDKNREETEIKAVATRLATVFDGVPLTDVTEVVEHAYHHFDGSKVRTYVPLLVEHAARDELTSASRSSSR